MVTIPSARPAAGSPSGWRERASGALVPGAALSVAVAGALAATLAACCAALALSGVAALPAWTHPDAGALADAGWRRPLAAWEALRLGGALAAALAGVAVGVPPYVAAPLAALAPSLVVRERARAARERGRRGVTRALVAAHATLRSGAPLVEALRSGVQATEDSLARRPFAAALAAFALGAPLDLALRDAAAREPDERTRLALATLALGIAERLSVERVAALVGAVAERLAFDDRLDEEIRARASGARTQVRLLALVVPCLALYLALMTPGVADTLGGPLGRTVLVPAAAVLEVAGIVLSRRFVAEALR